TLTSTSHLFLSEVFSTMFSLAGVMDASLGSDWGNCGSNSMRASSQPVEGRGSEPSVGRFRCDPIQSDFASSTEPMLTNTTSSPVTDKTRRRRRKPEAAETEILNAGENFLREFPFRDMTVDAVMSRTGLSRSSFYEYFRDRNHLVIKLT